MSVNTVMDYTLIDMNLCSIANDLTRPVPIPIASVMYRVRVKELTAWALVTSAMTCWN